MADLHALIVFRYPSSMQMVCNAFIYLCWSGAATTGATDDNDCKRVKASADAQHRPSLGGGAAPANKIHQRVTEAVVGLLAL